ncbi:MAG: hypothetical protein N2234_04860, partial [Planctomycetota bacterium]|nr:hypothetical protein [Planctomycetota bacterium]
MKNIGGCVGLLVFLGLSLYADTVYLNDGRVIKGRVVKEDEEEIIVEGKLGRITIRKEEIDKIVREREGEEEEKPPAERPLPEKPETEKIEEILKKYLRGEEVFEKLKEKGDAAVVVVKREMRKAKEGEKERLKKLFDDLTAVSAEKAAECERWYKEGVKREEKWWGLYNELRKQGVSQKEAVSRTAKELAEAIKCFQTAVAANRWYE